MTGIIDLASKTAEGLKNNLSEVEVKEIKSRFPRVFYMKERIFKSYNLKDAELLFYF